MYRKFEFIHRNPKYKGEVYGYLKINPETDDGVVYLLDDYSGLHAGYVFDMYRQSGRRVIEKWEFQRWLSLRVCPPERHNIKDVLQNYGLEKYSAAKIYLINEGRNDRDDMMLKPLSDDADIQLLVDARNKRNR